MILSLDISLLMFAFDETPMCCPEALPAVQHFQSLQPLQPLAATPFTLLGGAAVIIWHYPRGFLGVTPRYYY